MDVTLEKASLIELRVKTLHDF